MEVDSFILQLNSLEFSQWQQLQSGNSLLLGPDQDLLIAPPGHPDNLLKAISIPPETADSLKQFIINQADAILANYYLTHPLSAGDFNAQVKQLVNQLGASQFIASWPHTARYTLFVEGGSVIAEQSDSPRHRYGIFMERNEGNPANDDARSVFEWLESGQAYQEYLSSNCCRYSCR